MKQQVVWSPSDDAFTSKELGGVTILGGGLQCGRTAAMVDSLQRMIGEDVAAGFPPRSIRMSDRTAQSILDLYGSYAVASASKTSSFMGCPVTIDNSVKGVVVERSRQAP